MSKKSENLIFFRLFTVIKKRLGGSRRFVYFRFFRIVLAVSKFICGACKSC